MKKFVMSMACVLAIALGLCACGDGNAKAENAESSAVSSITLKKDGSIESRLAVEGFGTDYSEEGLENLIDASISEYRNLSASSQVSLKRCRKAAQDQLVVEMTFNDSAAYAGWNNYFIDYMYASEMGVENNSAQNDTNGFFVGTISDAYTAGYGLETTLNAVSDSSKQSVSKSDLLSMGDNHIVILERYGDDEPIMINCYDDILYVGEGVTVTGKKSASMDAIDGYGIIVFQ